jgi:uncharacterized protein
MADILNLLVTLVLPVVLGVIAAVSWRRHGRSIRKGFGFTFHWMGLVDFAAGLLITFLAMLGIFLVELLLGSIQVTGMQFDLASVQSVFGMITFGAAFEEVFFRSLLLSGLVVVLGGRKWLAILISAALFGIVHLGNPGASPISALGNALGGIIYGMAFLGGRNLWLPLGLHFSWNFSQGPILGFPVSGLGMGGLFLTHPTGSALVNGGAYGPEAGLVGMLFRFVIMAMLVTYLQLRCGRQGDLRTLEFPIKEYAGQDIVKATSPAA